MKHSALSRRLPTWSVVLEFWKASTFSAICAIIAFFPIAIMFSYVASSDNQSALILNTSIGFVLGALSRVAIETITLVVIDGTLTRHIFAVLGAVFGAVPIWSVLEGGELYRLLISLSLIGWCIVVSTVCEFRLSATTTFVWVYYTSKDRSTNVAVRNWEVQGFIAAAAVGLYLAVAICKQIVSPDGLSGLVYGYIALTTVTWLTALWIDTRA